jgi:nucleotide-binding universal stress UspA family protein
MYRSVIVPLDRSAASEHVLPIAVQIAHGSDATLRLVYIPNPEDVSMQESQMPLAVILPARSSMVPQAYLEHIRKRLAARSCLRITADVLHEPNVHASDTDLVVLATHGHNGLARFRLGDIIAALVRWYPAPILALRPARAAPDPEVQPLFRQR